MPPVVKAPLVAVRVWVVLSSLCTETVVPALTVIVGDMNAKFLITMVSAPARPDEPPELGAAEVVVAEVLVLEPPPQAATPVATAAPSPIVSSKRLVLV